MALVLAGEPVRNKGMRMQRICAWRMALVVQANRDRPMLDGAVVVIVAHLPTTLVDVGVDTHLVRIIARGRHLVALGTTTIVVVAFSCIACA